MKKPAPLLLILLLWFAGLGAAGQFAKVSTVFSTLQNAYPDYGSATGFLVSTISLCGMVFGLFVGIIVPRFGLRKILLASLLFGAMISLFQATIPSFGVMLITRVLEGFSHLGIVICAPTLIAQVSGDKYRSSAMVLWGTFFGITFAFFAWFSPPLVQAYGISALFSAHGCFMLIIAAMLAWLLPITPFTHSDNEPFTLRRIIQDHITAYTSPTVGAPAIGWLFYTLTFVSLLTIIPPLLAQETRAIAATLMPLAGIFISMSVGIVLLRYYSAVQSLIIGFALGLIFAIISWLVGINSYVFIALFCSLGLIQGASFAAIPQLNKQAKDQALATGAIAQTGNIGNFLGTPILLWVLTQFGLSSVMIAISLCYIVGMGAHIALAKQRSNASKAC